MTNSDNKELSLDLALVFPNGDLKDGDKAVAVIDGRKVLFCHAGGVLFASTNECPHQGASLVEGKLRGVTIICPLHGARFDLRTGKVLGGSSYPPLQMLTVRLDSGKIWVRLPAKE